MSRILTKVVLAMGCGVVAATVAAAQAAKEPTKTGAPAATPQPRTAEGAITLEVKNPQRHEQFLARIKEGPIDLLFLGDSITDAWPRRGKESWEKFAPYNPADFGISGDRTEHVLWRITHGELDGIKPKVVVLMIGTNNIGHFPDEQPEWAARGIEKIVETIHANLPETKVLLLGVFPRGAKDSPAREKVEGINRIIAKLDDGKTTRYLEIGKVFLDADGEIPKDVMPDALHPSDKGYDLWYNALRPSLEKMMTE